MLRACQSLALIVQYAERNLLLLVTTVSDLPLRTNRFCSVLFSSANSPMRGDLCRKQTCTVTVIHYCTEDRQLLIAHCSSHRSIASYSPRIVICTCLQSPAPLGESPLEYCHDVWCGKNRMVWLPDGEKMLKICLLVSTEYTNVTDRRTDGRTPLDGIGRACIASRGKNAGKLLSSCLLDRL